MINGVVVQGNNATVISAGGEGAQAAGHGSVLAGGIDGNVTADNRRIEKGSRDKRAKKKRKKESPTAGPVFDQSGSTVHGNQYNVRGDLNIHGTTGHAGATGAGAPPAAGTAAPADKPALRDALNALSLPEIQVLGATIDVGLAPAMSKQEAIAHLLNWAATAERARQLAAALGLAGPGSATLGSATTNEVVTKVLLVLANPSDTDELRLSNEDRTICEAIALSPHRDRIEMDSLQAARIDDFARALLKKTYRIVHFSGHGTAGGLVFEDELSTSAIVPAKALAATLAAHSPPLECAILNACYSDVHGEDLSLGLPYTIVMTGEISDTSATEFSRGFYDAIGAGRDIPFAFAEGRRRCALKGMEITASLIRGRLPGNMTHP
jgi:hypothetical protein